MDISIPRLELEDLPADLVSLLQPRIKRLGYLGEFFQCAAHQPKALLSFMTFTDDLKQALPDNLTEVVALTVAGRMENHYERNQHEQLCRKLGFADAWIGAVNARQPHRGAPLTAEEQVVQHLTLAVLGRQGHNVQSELQAAAQAIGPARSIAVLLLIGRYVTHAFVVNALELRPPVPSIFDELG
jgi:hypothetical protein